MKTMQRTTLMLALAGALSMPTALLAAEATQDEHAGHHSDQVAAQPGAAPVAVQERMQTMRKRMMEIRGTTDPEKRKPLIEAQMKDMEAMMADGSCPMADGKGGMGMMGPGMGMGMMGQGMGMGMMGQGMAGQDDMMAKRMEMMEKRMDMMQMMMRMRMGMPAK